jgi:hypothetical protein
MLLLLTTTLSAQTVLSDTVYLEKIGNIYYITTTVTYDNLTQTSNKQLLGDSAIAVPALLNYADFQVNDATYLVRQLVNTEKTRKRLNYYNNLHQQLTNKPIYVSSAKRDSSQLLGDWVLVIDGDVTNGEIKLNTNDRLVFNPNKDKSYIITQNLLLATVNNYISFTFNDVKYELYKISDNRYFSVDSSVKLIKKE